MTDDFTKMFATMMAQGQEMAKAFAPAMEGMDVKGFEKLFPTRLLVTIAALTVQGALAEPQLRLTIRQALTAGATKRHIAEVIWQMSMFGGLPAMQKALEIAQSVFAEDEETKK